MKSSSVLHISRRLTRLAVLCQVSSVFINIYTHFINVSSFIPFITLIFLLVSWFQKSSLPPFPSPFKNSELTCEVQIRFKFQSGLSYRILSPSEIYSSDTHAPGPFMHYYCLSLLAFRVSQTTWY